MKPELNVIYTDYNGRELIINKIDIGNRLGREVQGIIYTSKKDKSDYSCTLKSWEEIWWDKLPPMNPDKMKIG
jgi:hypothetical protein